MPTRSRLTSSYNAPPSGFEQISDASMSFQIPTGLSNEEYLLDSDPGEFLEDVAPTPGPSRLRLAIPSSPEEATPRPTRRLPTAAQKLHNAASAKSHPNEAILLGKSQDDPQSEHSPESPTNATPRPTLRLSPGTKSRTLPETSPVKERMDALRSSLQEFEEEDPSARLPVVVHGKAEIEKPLKAKSNEQRPTRSMKSTTVSGGAAKKVAKAGSKPQRRVPSTSKAPSQGDIPVISPNAVPVYQSTPRITAPTPLPPSCEEHATLPPEPQLPTCSGVDTTNPVPELLMAQPSSSIIAYVSPKRDDPLTISQLSPSKQSATHQRPIEVSPPASPRRSLGKRPISATLPGEAEYQARPQKRGKASTINPTVPSELRPTRSTSLKLDSGAASMPSRPVARGRVVTESQLDRGKSLRKVSSTTSKSRGLLSSGGASRNARRQPERLASSDGALRSRPARSSRLGTKITAAENARKDQEKLATTAQAKKQAQKAKSVSNSSDDKENKRVAFPLINATKPVEFTFRSDVRLEARKSQSEHPIEGSMTSSNRRRVTSQIPDYKALHAQDEARRSLRKAPVAPTIPQPFQLHLEHRVRERQEFDEQMREKERQLEIEMEQKQKEREAEEEREIKEIRKKAIPKAHVVPDWYKDAPKRKTRSQGECVAGRS